MKVVKAIMGLVVGLACSAVPASPATAAPTGTPMSCGMVVREDVTLYLTKDLHCATFVVATASPYEEGTTAVHIVLNLRGHTLFGPGSGRGVSAIGSTFKPPTLEVNDGRLTGWDEAISGDGLTRLRNVVLSRNRIGFGCDGRLDPAPPAAGATLTENDGTTVPVVWRSISGAGETLPLYPSAAEPWVINLASVADETGVGA